MCAAGLETRAAMNDEDALRSCAVCGVSLADKRKGTLVCSYDCRVVYARKKRASANAGKVCGFCGIPFDAPRRNCVYCSPLCKSRAERVRNGDSKKAAVRAKRASDACWRDKENARARVRYQTNISKVRDYCVANKANRNASARSWYWANRNRAGETSARWKENNPDRVALKQTQRHAEERYMACELGLKRNDPVVRAAIRQLKQSTPHVS